jgi:uncharacterized protein (UPF0332 family)
MSVEHHYQLLALARELCEGKPTRAELHRAVSTAYYALFHLLIREGTRLLSVGVDLRRQAARAFEHGPTKDVCDITSKGNLPKGLVGVVTTFPDDLKSIAKVFVELQQLRHDADYKPNRKPVFTKSEVQDYVAQVEAAFAQWQSLGNGPEVKAFLLALLLHKKWDR